MLKRAITYKKFLLMADPCVQETITTPYVAPDVAGFHFAETFDADASCHKESISKVTRVACLKMLLNHGLVILECAIKILARCGLGGSIRRLNLVEKLTSCLLGFSAQLQKPHSA